MIELDTKEIELLKADLKAEIIKELTGQDLRVAQDISKPLAILWAKYKEPLYKKVRPRHLCASMGLRS